MDLVKVTNRAANNDKLSEKRKEIQHQLHMKRVQQIMKSKQQQKLKTLQNQNEKLTKVIKKVRETAKVFQQNEKKKALKMQNKILVQKLWKISQHGTNIIKYNKQDESNIKINHQSQIRKRISQKILYENKFIVKNIINQSHSKKSKSKIKEQIQQYLHLRENLRKVKTPQPSKQIIKSSKRLLLPRATSQRKTRMDSNINLNEQQNLNQEKKSQIQNTKVF